MSVAGSRVSVDERRAIWAGFIGRDVIGDPEHDVEIAISAEDSLSPSAVAGVLVAPPDTHLELAASFSWEATAHVAGDVGALAAGSRNARADRDADGEARSRAAAARFAPACAGSASAGIQSRAMRICGSSPTARRPRPGSWTGVQITDESNVSVPCPR